MAAELEQHEHGDLRWKVIATNNPDNKPERIALIDADVLADLVKRVTEYENTITWETTCHGCAASADSAIRETVRAEKAEASNARVRTLHVEYEGRCVICLESCACLDDAEDTPAGYYNAWQACPHGNEPYPCPTIRALEALEKAQRAKGSA